MYHEWQRSTLNVAFDYTCREWGDREALVYGEKRLTYRELRRQVLQLSKALADLGVRKGDKVAFLLPVVPEWACLFYATMRLGAISVPLNLTWVGREIEQGLRLTDADYLVVVDNFRGRNHVQEIAAQLPELSTQTRDNVRLEGLPHLKKIISLSPQGNRYPFTYDFQELFAAAARFDPKEVEERAAGVGPDDLCLYLLTSGTTSFPKPVMHSHESLLAGIAAYADGTECSKEDRMLIIAPNYHVAGVLVLCIPMLRGAAVHLIDYFEPEWAMQVIEREKISLICGFDTHFLMMKRHPRFGLYDISSITKTMIGSNPGSYEEIKAMGISHQGNIYGFSEYVASQAYFPYRDRFDEYRMKFSHGRPWYGTEFKVVDIVTGERLGPNQGGELCVKGPALFKGYYNMPEQTAASIDDEGFFHSGDYGWVDEAGYVYYRGRIKDTVKTGGENVSAREVEIFLEAETPWVQTAQVFGVPDPKWGEAVTAMVELKPGAQVTEEELREFCRGKIAGYKIPKHFIFVGAGEWPITPTGKYDKQEIRRRAIDILRQSGTELKEAGV